MVFHMKTTLEIPDDVYRRIKALAALSGRTIKDLVNQLLREMVDREQAPSDERGWRSVFGKASPADVKRVQSIVDDELSRIDPDEWR
jgi:predicted DNA-binding protein